MTNAPRIIYNLRCHHAALAPSTLVSGMLFCVIHQDYSPIVGVTLHEWRAKCNSCRFARWAGMSEATARIFVTGHIRRNNGHACDVEYVVNPEAVNTATKMREWRVRSEP